MQKQKRHSDSFAPSFKQEDQADYAFLLSPSDIGVRRNGGKNGARFAPLAILNNFKKLNCPSRLKGLRFSQFLVSDQAHEKQNFASAQQASSHNIFSQLNKHHSFIHLGGGHDHIFPLLSALENDDTIDQILIINIDAHLDTRIDNQNHSGTPFRNFDQMTNKQVWLWQYGIHEFANSDSTRSGLENIQQQITSYQTARELSDHFTRPPLEIINSFLDKIDANKCALVLSLDCDALDSSVMEGVSAVNHQGLPLGHIIDLLQAAKSLLAHHKCILGLYEYNPVMDNLSQKGARALAALIYHLL